ncbi:MULTISPECIES: HlyD family efflux transporter periplasmic adaptor subunit [Rhodopseudomonas]|uniref:efflux RND transporter periplasmic adaptor subunit n=1 Tax=Rhodopseudomonas TaxID=1073 RepID=UPI000164BE11|nr:MULTISPECIES: HlyD family efflux transporter periplasmic adaptor subunit [Rhodopseudomonas]
MASLRVPGFTRGEVLRILLLKLAILTLIAQPPGWLMDYGLAWVMKTNLAGELMRVRLVVEHSTYVITTSVVVLAAVASAAVIRERIDKMDLVAVLMQPTLPGFIDVRSRDQIQAEVLAADAAIQQQEAEVQRIEAALDFARTEFQRAQTLLRTQSTSAQAFDKAKFEVATSEAALLSAKARVDMRRAVRASLAARLMDPANAAPSAEPACCVRVLAPASGRVLKIIQDSEATELPGTPLVDIGSPLDLEVVADLLSTDAVQIKVGAAVRIDGWGGQPIKGRVVRVDPAGFLKVSALGIEEQRVRVTIDFVDPPETWSQLGHDYRVVVRVTTWSATDALTIPVSALFRKGDRWVVFADDNGHARLRPVPE